MDRWQFAIKSEKINKFLSCQKDGRVEVNRGRKGSWEKVRIIGAGQGRWYIQCDAHKSGPMAIRMAGYARGIDTKQTDIKVLIACVPRARKRNTFGIHHASIIDVRVGSWFAVWFAINFARFQDVAP